MYTFDDIQLKQTTINNLQTRYAELGEGPAVLFLHGWPESWYSWRHQMLALANAGYRTIAPDMPGYGSTEGFAKVEEFHVGNIAKFVVGLLDQLELDTTILIAHDWGSTIAWNTVQMYQERFSHLITMSVPLRPHSKKPPMEIYSERFGENFFYQLYFQEPGLAEAEFEQNPRAILQRLYCSPDTPRATPKITTKKADAGGWIDRLGEPLEMPEWISEADLDYYEAEFKRAGFSGGINYYRNIDRNWEVMAPYADTPIDIPTLFLAGEKDMVINGASREKLWETMAPRVPGLKDVILFPGIGHWVQQEVAESVNKEILAFLQSSNH